MELESIGRNIRKFRLMRNLRQEDLAEMAGLSINYVGALERGEKNTITRNLHCTLERFGGIIRYGAEQSIGGEASG